MKIVIAGAGSVGTHLSKLLSAENHDIVLMDNDKDRLGFGRSNLEMITMNGSPTSLTDLAEAGIASADLFIAVTSEESVNTTACMLASKMGAKKTFARIDNYEYLLPKNKEFFENLGVDMMVYPEMLAAKEVVSAIKRPWMRFWLELCGGAVILVGVHIKEGAPIAGLQLDILRDESKMFHIVAIKRGNTTIIPTGLSKIQLNDILYFTTIKEDIPEIMRITGKEEIEIKNIMMMGGSRIAIRTCQYLPSNMNIKLLESDIEKCEFLLDKVPSNVTVFHDDGRHAESLIQEGIEHMDAFVAVTGNSEANILACLAAKRMGVPKTITEVENMDYIAMAENLELDSIINKKNITIDNIYRLLLSADVSNVKSLSFANADVAEIVARPNSRITKKAVKDLKLPKNITLGGLIRNGEAIMISGDTMIEPEDHVVVFCLNDTLREAEKLFY